MEIIEKVKALLQERFLGAEVDIEPLPYSERVSGYLIWNGFEDLEQVDRQDLVISWLRQQLGAEARRVSVILTYSPNEYHMMSLA